MAFDRLVRIEPFQSFTPTPGPFVLAPTSPRSAGRRPAPFHTIGNCSQRTRVLL